MKPKIVLNENQEVVKTVKDGLKAKGGYCPCRMEKSEDTKCICKEFREQIADPNFEGYCHCLLYYKYKIGGIIMPLYNVTKESFEKIKASGERVLVDFYANWCGPCKMIAPILHEIEDEMPMLVIAKVNVDEIPELAIQYGVQSIPTLLVLEGGEVLKREVGFRTKEQILDLIKS